MSYELVLKKDGKEIKTFDVPVEILESLERDPENSLVVEYIGWATQFGQLYNTTLPNHVMTGETLNDKHAGFLRLTTRKQVKSRNNKGFLPYMTYSQRREKGLVK